MLCTFTTKDGSGLVVRSDDIRTIVDTANGTQFGYMEGDTLAVFTIQGTAIENRERIQREELDLIARVEVHRYETQKRLSEGYPVPSVKRGK